MCLGELLSDATHVDELGADAGGLTLTVQTTPADNSRPVEYVMPDCLHVRVGDKEVSVSVERVTRQKPFLGGFRHKVSGVQYHNASAQTTAKKRPGSGVSTPIVTLASCIHWLLVA